MNFSVPATGDGPEAEEGLEIPGFPKPHKPKGFAGNLQVHLENLASNANSIHHVLEALCGGLDRLEKKMDTNSSQVEARLANIVHHMSGEADEDTMSAWSSLNGGGGSGSYNGGGGLGSPGEICPALSLRRRSSFGMQMASFSENPLQELQSDQVTLESELAAVGRGSARSDRSGDTFRDVVERTKGVQGGGGGGEGTGTAPTPGESTPIGGAAETESVAAGSSAQIDGDGTVPSGDKRGIDVEPSSPSLPSPLAPKESRGERPPPAADKSVATGMNGPMEGRRRSNQDDQSSDSDSARGADSSITGGSVRGEEASRGGGSEHTPPVNTQAHGSIQSAGSDARYIARQRWIWAFGRVCQLVRRRKRKQFEIMSQRATDRAVRMGSRVSVIEKKLDETKEHLLLVGRLGDKSGVHTAQIHNLGKTVTELCKLLGVEERLQATVQAIQATMETALKSDLSEVEARLARGDRELETSLEAEIRRNGTKLEDMDDRYARGEEALRRAEERIGEVQEEVSAVTHSISEVERQLRVDEERLDSLENLKKAHQRRLSELRVQLEGNIPAASAAGSAVPMEADETDEERMARFLKAAGAATEFLAADLEKILETTNSSSGTSGGPSATAPDSSSEKDVEIAQEPRTLSNQSNQVTGSNSAQEGESVVDKLRHVAVEAMEFSRLCRMNNTGGGVDGSNRNAKSVPADAAAERAEALCGRIEGLLSAVVMTESDHGRLQSPSTSAAKDALERHHSRGRYDGGGNGKQGKEREGPTNKTKTKTKTTSEESSVIDGIVCPSGRKDLPLRLAAARDALVPVIGERSSVGSLKVALLRLQSSVERNQAAGVSETRWNDLYDRVSGLDKSLSDMKDSLRGTGRHNRLSMNTDMDLDNGGGGGGPDGGVVTEDDLEERLGFKADVSWVQRELQRLWDALDARPMATMGAQQTGEGWASRPRSAPSSNTSSSRSNKENDNPETAGEEESDLTPNSRVISTSLPSSSAVIPTGVGVGGSHGQRSSFNEGSSIIKDLLRKTSRLEQQVASKADNDEVMKALLSIGSKLRKVGVIIPAVQEALSNKIEKKDLTKLVALVSNGGSMTDGPPGSGNANNSNNNDNSAVLASRLNSKFRCLSCDRPLPVLGSPGPPKLGSSGLSVAGAGAPRSPQRTKTQPGQQRLRLTAGVAGGEAFSRPSSPAAKSPTSENVGDSDVAGWGGGSSSAMTMGEIADNDSSGGGGSVNYSKNKDVGGRRRQQHQRQHQRQHQQRGGDQPSGRLEPIGANGDQVAAVLSRYPRMMPPPSRVRTAAGGGIGSRPGSSSGGRI